MEKDQEWMSMAPGSGDGGDGTQDTMTSGSRRELVEKPRADTPLSLRGGSAPGHLGVGLLVSRTVTEEFYSTEPGAIRPRCVVGGGRGLTAVAELNHNGDEATAPRRDNHASLLSLVN